MIIVRAQGLSNTGESYTLTCTVTDSDGSSPIISWMTSDRNLVSNSTGLSSQPIITNGTSTVSVLLFNPLSFFHQNNYTCAVTVKDMTFVYTYPIYVGTSELLFTYWLYSPLPMSIVFRDITNRDSS